MKIDMFQYDDKDFWPRVDSQLSNGVSYACGCPDAPNHLGDCGTEGPGWMQTRTAMGCMAMRSDRTRCREEAVSDSPLCHRHLEKAARWFTWTHTYSFLQMLSEAEHKYAWSVIKIAQSADLETEAEALKSRVYFMAIGDEIVKIGRSVRPLARLAGIRQGSSVMPAGYDRSRIELLGTIPGGAEVETRLHRLLRPHRLKGEWFAQHPDVIAVMAYLLGGEMERDARRVFLDELTRPWWISEGFTTLEEAVSA